jgi:antitoxin VapB
MGLSIKDPETEALARKLAAHRGISLTNAIRSALAESLTNDNELRQAEIERKLAAIKEIQAEVAKLPVLMSDEEIDAWMYDENGLPH